MAGLEEELVLEAGEGVEGGATVDWLELEAGRELEGGVVADWLEFEAGGAGAEMDEGAEAGAGLEFCWGACVRAT